jgi:hypothetical protein
MEWRGIQGTWSVTCIWSPASAVDADGRPHGHGVLTYPAGHWAQSEEGAMAAGLQVGARVRGGVICRAAEE